MAKYMCIGMRCVYRVVSYELCNHTIVRPFKGDEFCVMSIVMGSIVPDVFNHKRDELK